MKGLNFIETLFQFGYHDKQLKYLVICTKRELRTSEKEGIYHAKNFATKREAQDYIRLYVPKIEQEDWVIYVKEQS